MLESGGDSLRRVALISSEVIFSPSSSYAIHSAQSPFPRMLAWMKAMGFAYTSCFPSLDILNPPALVSDGCVRACVLACVSVYDIVFIFSST